MKCLSRRVCPIISITHNVKTTCKFGIHPKTPPNRIARWLRSHERYTNSTEVLESKVTEGAKNGGTEVGVKLHDAGSTRLGGGLAGSGAGSGGSGRSESSGDSLGGRRGGKGLGSDGRVARNHRLEARRGFGAAGGSDCSGGVGGDGAASRSNDRSGRRDSGLRAAYDNNGTVRAGDSCVHGGFRRNSHA